MAKQDDLQAENEELKARLAAMPKDPAEGFCDACRDGYHHCTTKGCSCPLGGCKVSQPK